MNLTNKKLSKSLIGISIILLALTGCLLAWYATQWGPWAFSDSAAYVSSALNFNKGLGISLRSANGILSTLDHFPPLYPLLLALSMRSGLDYLSAGRILDMLSFALLLFSLGIGTFIFTKQTWLFFFICLLVLFSPVMLDAFTGLMTEPIFIALFYASFILTLLYCQQQKPILLIFAICFTSLLPSIRYAGIFACVSNAVLIFFFQKNQSLKRFRNSLLFGLTSSIPILAWFLFNYFSTHTLGARTFIQSGQLSVKVMDYLRSAGNVFLSWLPYYQHHTTIISDELKVCLFVGFLIALSSISFFFYQRKKKTDNTDPLITFIVAGISSILIYLFVLCAIFLFTSPPPVIDSRMLSPLVPAFTIVIGSVCIFFINQVPSRWKYPAIVIMLIFAIFQIRFNFLITLSHAKTYHEYGYGYTAREIQTSSFVKAIRQIPESTTLIANTPAMTLLYTNRMPYPLEFISTAPFGQRAMEIDRIYVNQKAALILDYAAIRNVYTDWEERLSAFTKGLEMDFQDEIGGIYYYPIAK